MKVLGASSTERVRWFIAVWVVCLVIFSLQPLRFAAVRGGTVAHAAAHALAFGVPTFVLVRARLSSARELLLCALLLALSIELAQHFVYRNQFEWLDVVADFLGAFFAILLCSLYRTRR